MTLMWSFLLSFYNSRIAFEMPVCRRDNIFDVTYYVLYVKNVFNPKYMLYRSRGFRVSMMKHFKRIAEYTYSAHSWSMTNSSNTRLKQFLGAINFYGESV